MELLAWRWREREATRRTIFGAWLTTRSQWDLDEAYETFLGPDEPTPEPDAEEQTAAAAAQWNAMFRIIGEAQERSREAG